MMHGIPRMLNGFVFRNATMDQSLVELGIKGAPSSPNLTKYTPLTEDVHALVTPTVCHVERYAMVHEETWELKVIIVQVGNMLGWGGCMRLCLMPTQTDRMSDLEPPNPDKADWCLEQHWTMRQDEVSSSISEALRTYRICSRIQPTIRCFFLPQATTNPSPNTLQI